MSNNQAVVTEKLGGVLPLASLDSRNVAAHPWHDLEIGELHTSVAFSLWTWKVTLVVTICTVPDFHGWSLITTATCDEWFIDHSYEVGCMIV